MSNHRVLDFTQPLNPEDIEPGNILLIHGKPRTIVKVEPIHEHHNRLAHMRNRLYANVGEGDSLCFYVFTCAVCGTQRALAGTTGEDDWFGITHGGTYTVLCSSVCGLQWLTTAD
jgi:hypothetical protein